MHQAQLATPAVMWSNGKKHRFHWLLLSSLGLHLLLILWPSSSELKAQAWPTLNLQLKPYRAPVEAAGQAQGRQKTSTTVSQQSPAATAPPPRQADHAPRQHPVQEEHRRPEYPQPATAASGPLAIAPSASVSSDRDTATPADEKVLARVLQLALAQHFHYPQMAKRRGWQGEVQLGFELDGSGRIHNARIIQSSGYTLLDSAALHALQQIGGIQTHLPASLQMELPVIYRLQEG